MPRKRSTPAKATGKRAKASPRKAAGTRSRKATPKATTKAKPARKALRKATPKRKRGRPRIEIDEGKLELMARLLCTYEEMAAELGCSVDTLSRNFADVIKEGQAKGRVSLRRAQMATALGNRIRQDAAGNKLVVAAPNPTMQIWLGKQLLGQRDFVRQEIDDGAGDKEYQHVEAIEVEFVEAP